MWVYPSPVVLTHVICRCCHRYALVTSAGSSRSVAPSSPVRTDAFILPTWLRMLLPAAEMLRACESRSTAIMETCLCETRCRPNGVVTVLARRGVSAARPPTRPACPPAGSVTDDDRRQRAKQHRPIRRASNKQ